MQSPDQFVNLSGQPVRIENESVPTGRRQAIRMMLSSAVGVAGIGLLSGCSTRSGSMTYIPGVWSSKSARENATADPVTSRYVDPRPRADVTPEMGLASPFPMAMPRSSWTKEGVIARLADPMVAIERITVHHDAIDNAGLRTKNDVARRLNATRSGHLARGWADIGYHYIIDPMGNVWEGRPVQWQGAHVKEANPRNLGVMVMGNFMHERPSTEAMASLERFLTESMSRYRVQVSKVYTHRELGRTLCPGTNLQNVMLGLRSQTGGLSRVRA
ncbi:MAG: N-acetylmuramoyl-L-alanine amidase [Phycisphaeraceae bacterium]|nr:N-acetylmuramoyl-L-alanine amidase [Phycisphaerales bacterium]MCB9861439.1 N-acetylmuramoyl-L-alanine amidase [Phycisphaeraceae bacterium]